jgi:putative effector of murein hydrolase LrgA (UPF0299 family)
MGLYEQMPILLVPVVICIVEVWNVAKRTFWSWRNERRQSPPA